MNSDYEIGQNTNYYVGISAGITHMVIKNNVDNIVFRHGALSLLLGTEEEPTEEYEQELPKWKEREDKWRGR